MTIKGRKALEADNEQLYLHNKALVDEFESLESRLKVTSKQLLSVIDTPLPTAIKNLFKLRKTMRQYKNEYKGRADTVAKEEQPV